MDNAMVKRGIGAVVLAIIAALLLGYLLKDKSRERQEVVDIKLPDAPEMNIPSLSDTVNKVGDSAASLVENTKENITDAGNSVVAAATGTAASIKNSVSSATDSVTDGKPGFSIRPLQPSETKQIVDKINSVKAASDAKQTGNNSLAIIGSSDADDTVVASTKKKESFKPQIVEKKKKPVKKAPTKPKALVKKTTAEKAPKAPKAPQAPSVVEKKKQSQPATINTAAAPAGKYSIQLLATSSQSRANKLATTMQGEGYKSFITQTVRDNKVLYRVRIGGHTDRNAAIKAQEGMKKRYQKNFFVQNSLVISNQ